MISNQILQDTIDGIKAITRIDLCVMDTEGKPLASTLDAVEEYKEAVLDLQNLWQRVRHCRDISFLKYLMRTS